MQPRNGFGHRSTGSTTEACSAYLDVTIADFEHNLARNGRNTFAVGLRNPQLVLLTIIDLLVKSTEGRSSWLLEDALSHLRTLVGSR